MEKHIVSFSGGKDSTAMLLLMIEKNYKIDEIIFLDTGMEFPGMYEHIEKVKKYIKRDITVLKAEKSFEFMMFDHEKKKGKNKGQKGYSWPDFRNRWCTQYLKKSVIKKYLKRKYKGYEVIEYHGIAIDEEKRLNKNKDKNIRYPLVEWNMTEEQALNYCYEKGFDWNGLYKEFGRVSCWCCPLKSLKELKVLYKKYPTFWEKLKEWDNKTYRKFKADYTIEELENKFEKEIEEEKMRLFEMKDEYNPNSYDREKKKRCFESNLELTTFIITEIWKMNDAIALAYKDLSLALNILDKNEKIKMSKGLNKVADDLERIAKELREHCSKEIKTVEAEEV